MRGAPDWYNTPLDKLEFEWSSDDKLELERYCQDILKNAAAEEMTPRQRFEATIDGRVRDRLLLEALYFNVYAVRTLDSDVGALKPVDLCRDPKLLVKAHLATLARYALDLPTLYPISYTHEFWGGESQMVDYGNPCMVGDPPIKSVTDLEGIEVPDPRKDGLYPGYLWACREIKRIFSEYGVDKVMPLWASTCVDPLGTAMMFMVGMTEFMIATRKDPDLCRSTMDLATEWVIKLGHALIDMGVDCLMMCAYPGVIPVKGNEWMIEYYSRIGKALGSQAVIWYALTYEKAIDWFPIMYEKEAVGPNSFRGWFCAEMDYQKVVDFSREHDLYCSCAIPDKILMNGPVPTIEEEVKKRCEYGKVYPKFAIGIAAVDYLTPQTNFEVAVAASKKYGRIN